MLKTLATTAYRRRRIVVAAWIVALVATVMLAGRFGGEPEADYATPGSESAAAHDLLEDRFPAQSGDTVVVVWTADDVTAPSVQARVDPLLDEAARLAHVIGVSPPEIGAGGTVAYATLQLDTWDEVPETAAALLDLAARADGAGVRVEVGGTAIRSEESGEAGSEGVGLLVAAVVLLVSFGSLLAMGLPIATAVFGLGVASALIGLLSAVMDVPDWASSVAAMIGIGVGIDYALFIVTRYRTGLRDGLEPEAAVVTAIDTAGRAVLFAGTTVMISLFGMFLMGLTYLHGVALSASLAVAVTMLAAVTLLPAILGFTGRNIDRLSVRLRLRRRGPVREARQPAWFRWSRFVQRRPWPAAVAGLLILLGLAAPALGLRLGFPDAGNDPEHLTTRRAYDLLSDGFGPGFNGTLLVVAERPHGPTVERLRADLAALRGVSGVGPAVTNDAGDTAVITVAPATSPQDEATERLLDTIRDDVVPEATAGTDVEVHVGGFTAGFVDQTRVIAGRLPLFIGAVVGLSFLLLLVVFRSVLVAAKAGVMNLLSILAAYGVIALVTDGGWAGELVGIHEASPVPSFIPMMMFAILFGLSMDYEVFLLSRVREEYVRTGDNAGAVADGLATTARVITAAAAIMVAVFGAFIAGDQLFLKVIGVGMATAILVDATVVRLLLVPATMELLGDRNWWLPTWLDRRLPSVSVEPVPEPVEVAQPAGRAA